MTASVTSDRLNQLLVDLNRSLLQYSVEVWPWSSVRTGDEVRVAIARIADQQRRSVERLAELLSARGVWVDLGIFPDEYTSLHFVSVGYLLDQILRNQQAVVAECVQLALRAARDSELSPLLSAIRDHEQRTLADLQSLQTATASVAR